MQSVYGSGTSLVSKLNGLAERAACSADLGCSHQGNGITTTDISSKIRVLIVGSSSRPNGADDTTQQPRPTKRARTTVTTSNGASSSRHRQQASPTQAESAMPSAADPLRLSQQRSSGPSLKLHLGAASAAGRGRVTSLASLESACTAAATAQPPLQEQPARQSSLMLADYDVDQKLMEMFPDLLEEPSQAAARNPSCAAGFGAGAVAFGGDGSTPAAWGAAPAQAVKQEEACGLGLSAGLAALNPLPGVVIKEESEAAAAVKSSSGTSSQQHEQAGSGSGRPKRQAAAKRNYVISDLEDSEADSDSELQLSGSDREGRGWSSKEVLRKATTAADMAVLNDLPPEILPVLIANSTQRRGKGGRQPAQDPRLDPKIDPKRAKRILANRMSAARSKMKQKLIMEGLKAKQVYLRLQIQKAREDMGSLGGSCAQLEKENIELQRRIDCLRGRKASSKGAAAPAAAAAAAAAAAPPSQQVGEGEGVADGMLIWQQPRSSSGMQWNWGGPQVMPCS